MRLGLGWARAAIAWRVEAAREWIAHRRTHRRVTREVREVIRTLQRLKKSHGNRPLCGILLVEHLGDIIACEPVIARARAEHRDAVLVWVVRRPYADLVRHHPLLDAVVTVESLAPVASIVRSGVLDVTIDLHVNQKPTGVDNVRHEKAWGDPTVDCFNYFGHQSILRAFSAAGGLTPFREQPRMYLGPSTAEAIDALRLPPRFVVVHTTSNEAERDWSADRWKEVVHFVLDECSLAVVEVGLSSVLDIRHPNFYSLCGKLGILETAEVIRRADFFIGVDSAPAHMANAWRRPALLLFGEYRQVRTWCPYDGEYAAREREIILRYPGPLSELPASAVISRLRGDLLASNAPTTI